MSVLWSGVLGLALGAGGASLAWRRLLGRRGATLSQEAKRTADWASERELLFRTLLDTSPVAFVFYGDTGRILYANRAAEQLFFDEQAPAGQNFLQLVAQGPERFRAALLGASDEIVGFDTAGQRETYHFTRRTIQHAGAPHTLLLVRPLTREVARHEIDVLKKVVRLISHEVNNSLAPVSSLVHSARQIVKTGERMERLERVFDTVDERAKHLAGFIAGYAALARLPRPQAQEVLWKDVIERLQGLFPAARCTAPADARGYFDPMQLEQALINLLKNAQESGGSPESVSLEVEPDAEGGFRLKVLDRGRGFSPDALEHALLPFYTTKPSGSGVGLTLVREVVDAHGGQLTLGAREGGGAVVSLRLPGRQKPVDAAARARLTLTRA